MLARRPNVPVEQVCFGIKGKDACPLSATKPGSEPPELNFFINISSMFSERKDCGAVFRYPGELRPYQWEAMAGLNLGRSRAEETIRERAEKNRPKQTQTVPANPLSRNPPYK